MQRSRSTGGRLSPGTRDSFGSGSDPLIIDLSPHPHRHRDYRDNAALRPQPKRDGPDFWPTPPSLIAVLIHRVLPLLPGGDVWEPACGDLKLAGALHRCGRHVIGIDLHDNAPLDFLRDDPPPPGRFGAIVTNPPFNVLDGFIWRGLDLIRASPVAATQALEIAS